MNQRPAGLHNGEDFSDALEPCPQLSLSTLLAETVQDDDASWVIADGFDASGYTVGHQPSYPVNRKLRKTGPD